MCPKKNDEAGEGHKSYKEWLREPELFGMEERMLRRHLITLHHYLKGGCPEVGVRLFSK